MQVDVGVENGDAIRTDNLLMSTRRSTLERIISERRERRERSRQHRNDAHRACAIAKALEKDNLVEEISLDALRDAGIRCLFRPDEATMTFMNMRVTSATSLMDDQPIDMIGNIYHIEDDVYGKGRYRSVLFWDNKSFMRTRSLHPIENESAFLLLVSLKIPSSMKDTDGPCELFAHTAFNSNVLSVTYNPATYTLSMTFRGTTCLGERKEHTFQHAIHGDWMLCVDASFNRNEHGHNVSFEVVHMSAHAPVNVYRKTFDIRGSCKRIANASHIEIGKGTFFLNRVQYHIGNLSETERLVHKNKFRKFWEAS